MALIPQVLASQLTPFFTAPTADIAECATSWGNAMQPYSSIMTPLSLTIQSGTASASLAAELQSVFTTWSSATDSAALEGLMPLLETAFSNYGTLVSNGIVFLDPLYTGFIPPPGDVGFANLPKEAATWSEGATNVANAIDAWMKTGVAQLRIPPYPLVNWS